MTMFTIGDTVIYGTQGVCKITNITKMKFAGELHEYYVLISVNDNKSTSYVPTDNEKLTGKMKSVLSPQQVDDLIDTFVGSVSEWIEDDTTRKEYFAAAIKSGDMRKLIEMITMLHHHRKLLGESKKTLHTADEKFLKEAEKLLNNEISYSLGIKASEVPQYIKSRAAV